MITDQDVTKLKKTFVTKTDFKDFEKKINKTFVTKVEFGKLEEKVDGITYELGDLKIEVAEVKETLIDMGEQLNAKMDQFLGNLDILQTESDVCTVVQKRHTEQIGALGTHTGFILPA